jgi:hypothetical protein
MSSFSIENREGDPEIFRKLAPELVATYGALDFIKVRQSGNSSD